MTQSAQTYHLCCIQRQKKTLECVRNVVQDGRSRHITEAGPGCPCVSNQGRNGPSLSGGLGGVGCMTCSLLVTIDIAGMYRRTEAMANPLDPAVFGSDIK